MISHPAEESRYTTQVQLWHQQLAPTIPIESFVEYLDADMLGLENRAQFYAPVEFAVHVRGPISGPAGAVRLHVPVHANEDWLPILEHRIGAMFGVEEDADVELKTLSGRSLDTFSPDELASVGKLNVFIDGQRARMHELPQVPMEYSINKMDSIHAWFHAVKEDLPEMLAQGMIHKSAAEMNAAIAPGGSVEHLIKTHLRESTTDWNEFVRVNHMNSPAYLEEEGSDALLDHIAGSIRSTLRSFVESSADDISTYLQSVEAERVAQQLRADGKDTDEYKPIFGNTNLQVKVSADDGFDMYHGIMESLFDLPTVETEVVNAIYTKPIAGCRWEKEPPRYGDAPLRLGTNAIALLKQIENAKTQAELKRIMDDNYMQLDRAAIALYFVRAKNMSGRNAPDLNEATLERMTRVSGLSVPKASETNFFNLFNFFDKKTDELKSNKPEGQSWWRFLTLNPLSWFGGTAKKPTKPAPPVPKDRQSAPTVGALRLILGNQRDVESLSEFADDYARFMDVNLAQEYFVRLVSVAQLTGSSTIPPSDDAIIKLASLLGYQESPRSWSAMVDYFYVQEGEGDRSTATRPTGNASSITEAEVFKKLNDAKTQRALTKVVDDFATSFTIASTKQYLRLQQGLTKSGKKSVLPTIVSVKALAETVGIVTNSNDRKEIMALIYQRFTKKKAPSGSATDSSSGRSNVDESTTPDVDDGTTPKYRTKQDLMNAIKSRKGTKPFNNSLRDLFDEAGADRKSFNLFQTTWANATGPVTKEKAADFLAPKFDILESSIEAHHPWNAQIHHTLKEVAGGVYPEYYTDRHMHEDMTQNAEYAGDVSKTYEAYHMFANAHPMPAGVMINAPVDLVPIECHAKKEEEEDEEKKNRSMRYAMGDEALDELVPIDNDYYDTLDELVPNGVGGEEEYDEAPPIVPIACHNKKKYQSDSDSDDDETSSPRRMGSEIPPRPPTISLAKAAAMRKNLVRVEQKHGFSGLPEVDDFF